MADKNMDMQKMLKKAMTEGIDVPDPVEKIIEKKVEDAKLPSAVEKKIKELVK